MTRGNAYELLTPHQARVVEALVREEVARHLPVVVALSGSHAYGFPSPDSDVDVKAVHLDPTALFLGLTPKPTSDNVVSTREGIKIDYTSNELGGVLQGVLQGNGNYIERLLGGLYFSPSRLLDEMQGILRRALSRRVAHHYRGFARTQAEQAGRTSVKSLLYAFRTLLTGAHLLRTGEIILDLPTLLRRYGFDEVQSLVEKKRAGVDLIEASEGDYWRICTLPRAFMALEDAREGSPLPVEPPNEVEVNDWLVRTRLLTA